MTKRAIPDVPRESTAERRRFDEAVKEDLERIIGVRGGKIEALPSAATTAQIVAKINEIIERLQ